MRRTLASTFRSLSQRPNAASLKAQPDDEDVEWDENWHANNASELIQQHRRVNQIRTFWPVDADVVSDNEADVDGDDAMECDVGCDD